MQLYELIKSDASLCMNRHFLLVGPQLECVMNSGESLLLKNECLINIQLLKMFQSIEQSLPPEGQQMLSYVAASLNNL